MMTVRQGAQAPARWRLFVCGLALLACSLAAASATAWMPRLALPFSSALTPDPDAALPAPTRYSSRITNTTTISGIKTPIRIDLDMRLSADLDDVLAFYRTQLGQLGWHEQREGAEVAADHVQLAFASPVGPALLKIGRNDDSTIVSLVQRNADVATRTKIMPAPGQAKLVFVNVGKRDAVLAINGQTIRQGAEDHAISLDLPPGHYPYRLSGQRTASDVLTVAAGDAWELTVGPDDAPWKPFQLY
jgi:hypothetical protein